MENSIERAVFDLLINKGMTFASAESCTGGNIAHLITLIPGSSEVFRGAVVTYATFTKTKVIGVAAEFIDRFGVVSKEVAECMAQGVKQLMESDFGVATTGVAGPSGGSESTPAGTVCMAVATPHGVVSQCCHFVGDRQCVIDQATRAAYQMLYDLMNSNS